MIRSHPRLVLPLGLALALAPLGACGPTPPSPRVAGETGAAGDGTGETGETPEDPREELAEAQRKQFGALLEPAEAFLIAVDPLAAAAIGKGELTTPPVTLDERQAIVEKLELADREAVDIDLELLPNEAAAGLRGIRFALDRERDAVRHHPPARTDPTYLPRELIRLVDEVEWRLVTGGDCGACGRALERAAAIVPETSRDLTAMSTSGVAGGEAMLSELERRARQLAGDPDMAPSADKLATAAAAERATLSGRLTEVAAEPDARWDDAAPLRGSQVHRHLPDALGLVALRRRLGVEEGLDAEPRALFEGVEVNLERYAAMQKELPAPGSAAPPAPLTADRCDARWKELSARVEAHEAVPKPGKLDCAALARVRPDAIDDADLDLLLLDLGVIEHDRRRFRASQTPTIALVAGRLGPPAQLHVRRVGYAAALGLDRAGRRAMERGAQDLCQAGVALWVHAKLGEPSELDAWVEAHCPHTDVDILQQTALEDPRGALRGLLLGTLTADPVDIVRVDRFWWSPAGQQRVLAQPQKARPQPGPPMPVAIDEIPLDKLTDPDFVPPSQVVPEAPGGETGAPTP